MNTHIIQIEGEWLVIGGFLMMLAIFLTACGSSSDPFVTATDPATVNIASD